MYLRAKGAPPIPTATTPHIAIIGAGIGGLAAALRLAHAGARVSVFEAQSRPGGKMRALPSVAGPVDAGPTVLTMKPVFEALFAETGARLSDHVTLNAEQVLARHFWPDGTTLDLRADAQDSAEEIARVFGRQSAREFTQFSDRTNTLFDAFDAPMMQAPAPTLAAMTATVLGQPALIPKMASHQSLQGLLRRQFSAPRLAQLFARYATYVGGTPGEVPALLCLIWSAEQRGVWHVDGGMRALAQAIADRAVALGAVIHTNTPVRAIDLADGRAAAVQVSDTRLPVDAVLYNGDPRALREGLLGADVRPAVTAEQTAPRSLSARVLAFAATVTDDPGLAAHNVFFADDPANEYASLTKGQLQPDPTLYICAQDRFGGTSPNGPERFEIIQNAPPLTATPPAEEPAPCPKTILARLSTFGLSFDTIPSAQTMTSPAGFDRLFPGSMGSLYGRSPAGMMAAFKRPTARSRIPGLYLVGGGAHPGAGVPMATLSARHAAEAMISDLALTSPSQAADTPGGMLTA